MDTTYTQELHVAPIIFICTLDTVTYNMIWLGRQKNKHVGVGTKYSKYTDLTYASTDILSSIYIHTT